MSQLKLYQQYIASEREKVERILSTRGFVFDELQKHILGERYVASAVTTAAGRKIILTGHDAQGNKVIIKASSEQSGKNELEHERACREMLNRLPFAYDAFIFPKEIGFFLEEGVFISVIEFIETEKQFLDRPLLEQFDIAIRSLKSQEGAHAATYEHEMFVRKTLPLYTYRNYVKLAEKFSTNAAALNLIKSSSYRIDQFCRFLTHTDFIPQNIRVSGNTIYLLDHSSLRFGNKHEGWARFVNFMELHNPPLADAMMQHSQDNRSDEENESVYIMRVYRLLELIFHHRNMIDRTDGDLRELSKARVAFWNEVLSAVLSRSKLAEDVRLAYIETRDRLRSHDEKVRQVGLH